MLHRIDHLIELGETFAFETTLSTKTYAQKVKLARQRGYFVTLLYFWLNDVSLANNRVMRRVKSGGHYIPPDIVERRAKRGIANMFNIYQNIYDKTMLIDNSNETPICCV